MGYYLQALIGHHGALHRHSKEFRSCRIVSLRADIAMIPLTDEFLEEIGDDDIAENFDKLSHPLEAWTLQISQDSPVACVEAEYFGGTGNQSAVVWNHGLRVLGPIHAPDAINQALRLLGINAGSARDEFDAIGLGRHRDTVSWLSEYQDAHPG